MMVFQGCLGIIHFSNRIRQYQSDKTVSALGRSPREAAGRGRPSGPPTPPAALRRQLPRHPPARPMRPCGGDLLRNAVERRVGRAEFDKLVTFRIGSVRRSDGRTDGVLLTAALKCTITMRSSVRRNNIGLSVVRAVARFVADQHRRRIDFSSLSFFSWIHINHQHMRARARSGDQVSVGRRCLL